MNGVMEDVVYVDDSPPNGIGLLDLNGFLFGDGTSTPWFGVAALSLVLFGVVFSALKGKYGFVLLSILVPGIGIIAAIVGGIRLAKPRSLWSEWLYDRKAMAAAIERHEPPINLEDYPEPKLREGCRQPPEDSLATRVL